MVSIKTPVKKVKKEKLEKVTKVTKNEKKKDKSIEKSAKLLKESSKEDKSATKLKESAPVTPVKPVETSEVGKTKYVMPSKSITAELVHKCLAVVEKLAELDKQKNKLLDDEVAVFAEIQCVKMVNTSANIRFEFPHSTVASTGEICLITPDMKKGRKVDHEPTIEHWEEMLRQAGVTQVKTILPMRQLRVEFDQYELKRRLMTQHDFIMVDTRVLSHVSHILGRMFFKKHNMLVPVRIKEKNLKRGIEVGLRTVMFRLSEGNTSTVTVGHTGMSREALKENILSLVEQLKEKYPGGQANIRAINLKLPQSLAVPLYLTLRPTSVVNTPKIKRTSLKHSMVLEDEVTTVMHGTVRVAPDGTVKVKRPKRKPKSDAEDTENETKLEEEAVNSD